MRKYAFLALMLSLLFLSSCASKHALPNPKDASLAIQASTHFTKELQEMDVEFIHRAFSIDYENYTDLYMLKDTSLASTELIFFINAKDVSTQETILKNIEEYKQALIQQYKDYVPEELPKLDAALIKSKGLQTAFIVSPDQNAVNNKLNELWK